MSYKKSVKVGLRLVCLLSALIVSAAACSKPAPDLPKDILGVRVGMNKADADRHLRETAKFNREDDQSEQLWSLSGNPNFDYLAIGYDRDKQVRYVTAIAKSKDGKPVLFNDVGDLTKAKKEVVGLHHRYTWEIAASEKQPAYLVIAQGGNAESLSLYTLTKPRNPEEQEEEEQEEKAK